MGLWILRGAFLVVSAGLGAAVVNSSALQDVRSGVPWVVFMVVLGAALAIIAIDVLIPRKRIELITCVYFGVVIGLFLTYVVNLAITPLLDASIPDYEKYSPHVRLSLGVALCYGCISLLMQTKDDFRFIIPYVEFAKDVKGLKPYLLDTSVVIDGRIADVLESNVLDNQLVMPRFILTELQSVADSSDKLRRSRGRRGLDILNRLRNSDRVDLKIYDREPPELKGQPVDVKLVLLAKHLKGKIITGDYNLNKVARVQNVPVVNLNDLANALKPVFLPGESFDVRLVKPGESPGQGVGYLDDGTMIVVEDGRDYIHHTVRIAVTSVLQTSAGRMIFGRFDGLLEDRDHRENSPKKHQGSGRHR